VVPDWNLTAGLTGDDDFEVAGLTGEDTFEDVAVYEDKTLDEGLAIRFEGESVMRD
jgi:hypothetical protein